MISSIFCRVASFIYLFKCLLLTRVFFPNFRIVRFPIYIRGYQYIKIGFGFTTGRYNRIDAFPADTRSRDFVIKIGKNCQINDFCHIAAVASVVIGDDCLVGSKVFISDHDHGKYSGSVPGAPDQVPVDRNLHAQEVNIGDRVWIGENVCILPGSSIGTGSVIGAGSVVKGDFPPYVVLVGNPARILKKYNFDTNEWIKA